MGTHNALLKLGARVYLEIIAIDPEGAKPRAPALVRSRRSALQSELAERPRLIHWVARTDDIDARRGARARSRSVRCTRCRAATIAGASRFPTTAVAPARGIVPTLIQWDVPFHPADKLPASNVSLVQLGATCADPAPVREALAALGLSAARCR